MRKLLRWMNGLVWVLLVALMGFAAYRTYANAHDRFPITIAFDVVVAVAFITSAYSKRLADGFSKRVSEKIPNRADAAAEIAWRLSILRWIAGGIVVFMWYSFASMISINTLLFVMLGLFALLVLLLPILAIRSLTAKHQ